MLQLPREKKGVQNHKAPSYSSDAAFSHTDAMCSLHSGMQADSPAPAETFASKPEQSTAVPHKLMNDPKPIQALT